MKKIVLSLAAVAMTLGVASVALASSAYVVNFEAPTYSPGSPNGQDGWTKTGPYDAVIGPSYGVPGFGSQSLRIDNAITSGSFGDQTFAKPLADAAGEADSTDGSFSRGTLQSHFEAQFDFRSMMASLQPGMAMSISPDRGDGSRMSYLRFTDQADGVHVYFDDVQGTDNPANFVETDIATLDRSATHTIKFVMDFVDGPSNDVVKIYIDNALVHTGTSWENYYRYDSESAFEQSPRIVKTLIFRTGGVASPSTAGQGYLFDNLSLSSSNPPSCANPSAPQTVTYATSASTFFTVPANYCSITVQVWGAGGGGATYAQSSIKAAGNAGGPSSFNNSVVAGGGIGGNTMVGIPGAGGNAYGGDTNVSGNAGVARSGYQGGAGGSAPFGGTGGAGGIFASHLSGFPGGIPGAGGGGVTAPSPNYLGGSGGGSGAYATKIYAAGVLSGNVPVIVGLGGTGAGTTQLKGGDGATGRVVVTYTLAQ